MKKFSIKKNISLVLLLIFFLIPVKDISAQTSSAGFIPGNIWYSPNSFEEGDTVKIYTVVFNPDDRTLLGSVIFFDNNVFFAKKDFTVESKGVKDVSVEWKVTAGDHSIFGKIENAKFLISSGKYEEVYLAENQTGKSSRTVSKKIVAESSTTGSSGTSGTSVISSIIDSASSAGTDSISKVGQIIENNTPDFISTPATVATNALESFREEMATASKNKQALVKKEANKLKMENDKDSKKANPEMTADDFMEPLKFTELFALALFSNIFDNKFIFYTLLFLFVFLMLYYFVRRVK